MSTQQYDKTPKHVAIIMDGNGRWAKLRNKPRVTGHKEGIKSVREIISVAAEHRINYLTLFAFGQENWRRPAEEVSFLMNLFTNTLKHEVKKLHKNGVRFRVIGDRSRFSQELNKIIAQSEQLTAHNTGLQLNLAVNYSGRWDILQAVQKLLQAGLTEINETHLEQQLATANLPDPDLFIRSSGECRLSNFMLWQLAYTEMVYSEVLWPDFKRQHFEEALQSYASRQRRFGYTSEQVATQIKQE